MSDQSTPRKEGYVFTHPEHHLVVSYKKLGTIHPREQLQALVEDLNTLMDQCGVFYLTNARLVLPVTNEWGDPLILYKTSGERVRRRYDTNHYDPACRAYDL